MVELSQITLQSPEPILFQNKLKIYKPTLREISQMGYVHFSRVNKILTITETQLEDLNEQFGIQNSITEPFEYIITQSTDIQFFLEVQMAFLTYIKKLVEVTVDGFRIELDSKDEEKEFFILDRNNFPDFQRVIKQILMIYSSTEEREIITSNNKMKQKFLEKRKLLQKAKEKKSQQSKGEGIDLSDMISSLCAYGIGYNMVNVWDLNIYAFYDQFRRAQKKDKFEHDYLALVHGADKKKIHLENWQKPIT